jgi:uncharacterized membrane protein YtjA (UPF0391 family)
MEPGRFHAGLTPADGVGVSGEDVYRPHLRNVMPIHRTNPFLRRREGGLYSRVAADRQEDSMPAGNLLYYALVALVIALIAAFLGFGGIAGTAAGIAQLLFYVFLVIFVIVLIMNFAGRGRSRR